MDLYSPRIYLEFSTPKTKNDLALVKFIAYLPIGKIESPINETLPDEHIFIITTNDSWYGDILTYLRT